MLGKNLEMKLALADAILKAADGDLIQVNRLGEVRAIKIAVHKVEKIELRSKPNMADIYYRYWTLRE